LPGGEVIDRVQKIARNVADRQYLNIRPLRRLRIGLDALPSRCPRINLGAPSPAIIAESVVVVLFICIYVFLFVWVVVAGDNGGLQKKFCLDCLMHLSPLSPGTAGRSSEKSFWKSGTQTFQRVQRQSRTRMGKSRTSQPDSAVTEDLTADFTD